MNEKTARGFNIYGRISDARASKIRVIESSAMGVQCCHVVVADSNGREFLTGIAGMPSGIAVVSPYLDKRAAQELIAALQAFVSDCDE